MGSKLIISQVDKLQFNVNANLRSLEGTVGIYVSLNKAQKNVEANLIKEDINFDKIFFIDCVNPEKESEDIIHCYPNKLDLLSKTIKKFIKEIPGEKFIIIDALSTLLIYNPENQVAAFVKEIIEYSSEKTKIIALSPETQGEELLGKIFNFFEEVQK